MQVQPWITDVKTERVSIRTIPVIPTTDANAATSLTVVGQENDQGAILILAGEKMVLLVSFGVDEEAEGGDWSISLEGVKLWRPLQAHSSEH